MPYKLRKAPNRDLYWVVGEDDKKHSKEPITLEKAKAQIRAIYANTDESKLKGSGAFKSMLKDGLQRVVTEAKKGPIPQEWIDQAYRDALAEGERLISEQPKSKIDVPVIGIYNRKVGNAKEKIMNEAIAKFRLAIITRERQIREAAGWRPPWERDDLPWVRRAAAPGAAREPWTAPLPPPRQAAAPPPVPAARQTTAPPPRREEPRATFPQQAPRAAPGGGPRARADPADRKAEIKAILAKEGIEYIENPTEEQRKAKLSEFRKASRKLHPDSGGDTQLFQKFVVAFREKYGAGRKLTGSGVFTKQLVAIRNAALASVPDVTERQRDETKNMLDHAKAELQKFGTSYPKSTEAALVDGANRGDPRDIKALKNRYEKQEVINRFAKQLGQYFNEVRMVSFPAGHEVDTVIGFEPVRTGMIMTDINNETGRRNVYTKKEIEDLKATNRANRRPFISPLTTLPVATETDYVAHIDGDEIPVLPKELYLKTGPKRSLIGKFQHWLKGSPKPKYLEDEMKEFMNANPIFRGKIPLSEEAREIRSDMRGPSNVRVDTVVPPINFGPPGAGVGFGRKRGKGVSDGEKFNLINKLIDRSEILLTKINQTGLTKQIFDELDPLLTNIKLEVERFLVRPRASKEDKAYLRDYLHNTLSLITRQMSRPDFSKEAVGFGKKRGGSWQTILSDIASGGFEAFRDFLIKNPEIVVAAFGVIVLNLKQMREVYRYITGQGNERRGGMNRAMVNLLLNAYPGQLNSVTFFDSIGTMIDALTVEDREKVNAEDPTLLREIDGALANPDAHRGEAAEHQVATNVIRVMDIVRGINEEPDLRLQRVLGEEIPERMSFAPMPRKRGKGKVKCKKCGKLKGGSDEADDDEVAQLLGAMEEETGLEDSRPRGPVPPKRPTRIERPPMFEAMPERIMPKPARRQGTKRSHARMLNGFGKK